MSPAFHTLQETLAILSFTVQYCTASGQKTAENLPGPTRPGKESSSMQKEIGLKLGNQRKCGQIKRIVE